ncbi:MAG: acetate kinase [Bacteroidales bacterium]
MKVLVLNCGSSSIKYKLFNTETKTVLAQGGVEKIGLKGSFLKIVLPSGEKVILEQEIPEHTAGIEFILEILTSSRYGCISSLKEIEAVGHRIVHGGEKFNTSVLITPEVKQKIVECFDIAPLHNPANMKGIEAVEKILPCIPQVGVFDTAFHQTIPPHAYMYAIPYDLYEEYGVRRYGFHGTSHRYVSRRACDFLGVDYKTQRMITCHIGNGGSITAVCKGKSVDTSMGLTPVEGLMMGTRSGDVDAGALVYIMDKKSMSPAGLSDMVNKQSGVLGVSGVSSDMRELDAAIKEGNQKAILALEMYDYHIAKYIGSYIAALNGVDIIVFTGGVGENQSGTRSRVCSHFSYMGLSIDEAKNSKIHGEEAVISTPDSTVTVVVVPTDEELMIALDTQTVIAGE